MPPFPVRAARSVRTPAEDRAPPGPGAGFSGTGDTTAGAAGCAGRTSSTGTATWGPPPGTTSGPDRPSARPASPASGILAVKGCTCRPCIPGATIQPYSWLPCEEQGVARPHTRNGGVACASGGRNRSSAYATYFRKSLRGGELVGRERQVVELRRVQDRREILGAQFRGILVAQPAAGLESRCTGTASVRPVGDRRDRDDRTVRRVVDVVPALPCNVG